MTEKDCSEYLLKFTDILYKTMEELHKQSSFNITAELKFAAAFDIFSLQS